MATLSPAERELLAVYTRQAYEAYLSEDLKETQNRIAQIEALNPGDIHARFLKGAVVGRKSRPGTELGCILTAVELWRPLYEQLEGEALTAIKNAIAEALSTILYIPVDLAARQWDTYCDVRTAENMAAVIRTLLEDEDRYRSRTGDDYAQWIAGCFADNYVFLADEIIGLNKPIPVGAPASVTDAYEKAMTEAVRMAERIPETGESGPAVRRNAAEKLRRFREHNPKQSAEPQNRKPME